MTDDTETTSAPHPADLWDAAVPFVQRQRGRDGQLAGVYFRRAGWPRVRLETGPAAAPLAQQVATILATRAPPGAEGRPVDVRGALRAFEGGPAFAALAPATQREYRRLCKELEATLGQVWLADVDAAWLLALRDAWEARGYKACNDRLTVLAAALHRPTQLGDVTPGLFAAVGRARRPRHLPEPHPVWTAGEVAAVIEAARAAGDDGLARAVALGRWVGARPGDVVRLPESARALGRISWIAGKNRQPLDLLERPELAAVLNATPRRAVTLVYRPNGSSYPNVRDYQRALRTFLDRLSDAALVRPGLDAYGLRHAYAVELAETGASDAELQAALGDLTPAMAARYRRQAQTRKLADAAHRRAAPVTRLAKRRSSGEGGEG